MSHIATRRRARPRGPGPGTTSALPGAAWQLHHRPQSWFVRTPAVAKLAGSFARAVTAADTGLVDTAVPLVQQHHTGQRPFGEPREREHGDRQAFLASAGQRLDSAFPVDVVRPLPLLGGRGSQQVSAPGRDTVPSPSERDGLVTAFAQALEGVGGTCHVVDGDVPERLLDELVSELEAWDVVASAEPEAQALAARLADRGAEVHEADPERSAAAALGISSASAAIAATGSIVLDTSHTASRSVSVLPPVHLCVLPAERIVAATSDVLRGLSARSEPLAPSLLLVSGPPAPANSVNVGGHGPAQLHVIVLG